jgi:glycosyltransferase involved in cell wall biosynthesis
VTRTLLVDPSSRGGLPVYTTLVARSLAAAGERPATLGSVALADAAADPPVVRRLPDDRWGTPVRSGALAFPERLWRWCRSALAVEREVRAFRPDVVHFQAPLNRRLDAFLLRRLSRRTAVVWTAHNVLPFERTAEDSARFAEIYRTVDRVIVHTPPAATALRELAGVEPVVVDHPVPEPLVRLERGEARERLGLDRDGRLLVALGFIRAYKGYDLLADVWDALGAEAPRLLVLGELHAESQRHVLERLARSGRADVRIGYAADTDLHAALAAADALLLPYVTASDSGLLHLARAFRVPVIASDAPELAASVRAARAGSVVPREVDAWTRAVSGALPPPPPAPPELAATGNRHLAVYREAVAARTRARFASLHLAVYTDADRVAGAEHALAALLAGLDPAVRVTVVGTDAAVVHRLAEERPGAATAVLRPVRGKTDLRGAAEHLRALRRLRPDVLHHNLRHPYACQYALAAGLATRGVRVVAVEHRPVPAADGLQRLLKRLTSRRLAAHVAVSDSSAREVERLAGLPDGSVRTIHNGLAPVAPSPRRGDGTLLGAAGRFVPQKGFDVLLRALAELPQASLLLVGDGPERPRLERLVAELGLGDRVERAGWRPDAARLLATVDAVVVPSRAEPFGLVALEAMGAGVPVVASDVDGLAEVVTDGETGLLVPPDDPRGLAEAIARVLVDRDLGRSLGDRGREAAATRFSRERMTGAFEELYRAVLR